MKTAMRPRLWPRSIRNQLLVSLLLLEVLSLALFVLVLYYQQTHEINTHTQQRLEYQSEALVQEIREALDNGRTNWIQLSLHVMAESPSVVSVRFTDPSGRVLYASSRNPDLQRQLSTRELKELAIAAESGQDLVHVFYISLPEGVRPVYQGGQLRGYVWIVSDLDWDYSRLQIVFSSTAIFAAIWISASILLILALSRSITSPLAVLHRGTRALMQSPENPGPFPLPVTVQNEIGDLVEAFNLMVASIAEQREGLHDTLSILDSMLANAPIGFAFFDQRLRFVRINRVLAGMTELPISRHLGRSLGEVMPASIAGQLEQLVRDVFAGEPPVRGVEISGEDAHPVTWMVSAYPVRTEQQVIRWVGVIVLDASQRKRSEEALRRSEKLAATGRLAASIAHEINNPLEAVTNLLYLLHHHSNLDETALGYVEMAEHELGRVASITQQTLQFYRQTTQPTRVEPAMLLESVLTLYRGRLASLRVEVERRYQPEVTLFCFAGELRQVLANLVGNALDAMPHGGRLLLRLRSARDEAGRRGVRITVADTGSGMMPEVRQHIFEAFFTTKESVGTGLGLWVSHEIILKHHGKVRLRSRAGGAGITGTVFSIFLPDGEKEPLTGTARNTASLPKDVRA